MGQVAKDRAARAKTRADEARCRAAELRDRGARLAIRQAPTAEDVRRARNAAHIAQAHAREARKSAAKAYGRAAAAHRAAAQQLRRFGLPDQAALHLKAAILDDTAGAEESRRLLIKPVVVSG